MSFKSDIYSLGVMIKEMVTGSREEPNIATVSLTYANFFKAVYGIERFEFPEFFKSGLA